MTVSDLLDSIGNVETELLEKAERPEKPHRKIILIIGSLAACAALAVTGIAIAQNSRNMSGVSIPTDGDYHERGADISSSVYTGGVVSEVPHTEQSDDIDPEEIESEIYFIRDGKIQSRAFVHKASAETVFELWKNQNRIGDDVRFISATIESDASVTESSFEGQGVTTYHAGNWIYQLTVTRDIENYYSRTDKALLLESLQKTMLAFADMKIHEYKLILSEG